MLGVLLLIVILSLFVRIDKLLTIIRTKDFKDSFMMNTMTNSFFVLFHSPLIQYYWIFLLMLFIYLTKTKIEEFYKTSFSKNFVRLSNEKPNFTINGFGAFFCWLFMTIQFIICGIASLYGGHGAVLFHDIIPFMTVLAIVLSSILMSKNENYRLFWYVLASVFFIFLAIDKVALAVGGGLSSNINIDDSGFAMDDGVVTPTPDMEPTDFGDFANTDVGAATDINSDIGPVDLGTDGTGFDTGSSFYPDSSFAYSGSDFMGGHFMDVFGGTNMTDIPYIQQHPYMIFSDSTVHGNFQICDPSGMPQMSVSDGNILNAENVIIGHVNIDPSSGTTTFTDVQNTPLYSVDSLGQMFSDNCYIGRKIANGNIAEIRDIHEHLVTVKDSFNGVWRDTQGHMISQVKPK